MKSTVLQPRQNVIEGVQRLLQIFKNGQGPQGGPPEGGHGGPPQVTTLSNTVSHPQFLEDR